MLVPVGAAEMDCMCMVQPQDGGEMEDSREEEEELGVSK